MVKVKLCGNRTLEDVETTAAADAQGFIVLTDSRREIDLETAAELMASVPLFNTAVLVTTVTDPLLLADLVEVLEPDALQIHVELSPLQAERIRRALPPHLPLVATLGVDDDLKGCLARAERMAEGPLDALLLDSQQAQRIGGTGQTHDWGISARICAQLAPFPVILAGGLTPENVREAVETVHPYAIDVASGVETAGKKDASKVQKLLEQVRRCDHER